MAAAHLRSLGRAVAVLPDRRRVEVLIDFLGESPDMEVDVAAVPSVMPHPLAV